MEVHLIPDTSRLSMPARVLHVFLSLGGILGMLLLLLVLVLEIKSGNGRRPSNANWLALFAFLAIAHVLWELGRSGPLPRMRWIAFGLCVAELMFLISKHISDPTARVVFTWMLGVCSSMIFAARLMVRKLGKQRDDSIGRKPSDTRRTV